MTFTVVWVMYAQNELARIWNNAPDRAAVTAPQIELIHCFGVTPSH
ncbi:MAG TPA: hypothetical protein VGG61_14750 [Gemmataceae bacterium]|jgi:hypothetical protein